jgi:hypothetical protein
MHPAAAHDAAAHTASWIRSVLCGFQPAMDISNAR